MSSAPSVPGVEVGASWLGGCGHVLTAGALETASDIIAARSKACRSDATSLTRWTGAGTPVWHSTRTAALSR
jgi:hypothetical protein